MFIIEKNSWMKDKGNLDSHSISVIYNHTRFISIASANGVCSLTHAKGKENPRPLRPHSLAMDSSATLHPKLDGCWRRAQVALQTAWDFAPTAFRRLSTPTFQTLVDWGFLRIGPGIFLMEKVINLAKYSLISYRSPPVAVIKPAEIAMESLLFQLIYGCSFMCPHCEHKSGNCGRGQSEMKFYLTIPDDFRERSVCSISTYHGRHGLNL